MLIKRVEEFDLFKVSRTFVRDIYKLTDTGKFFKDYGLKDQLQRASVSIILNIAEGFDSGSPKSFKNFLRYSYRSSTEVKVILLIALDIEYITLEQFKTLNSKILDIQKMTSGLINYLEKKDQNQKTS